MAPDLPDKLLGISIGGPSGERRRDTGTDVDEEEEVERFVYFSLGELRFAVPVDDVKTIVSSPDLTRVPRSSDAIDGITDLRGEITAVIDSRVHFPVEEEPGEGGRILVFDRPTDRQSAAIRVDEVLGVETVPVRDVIEDTADLDAAIDDSAFDHPLVVGIVRQERRPEAQVDDVMADATAGTGSNEFAPGSNPLETRARSGNPLRRGESGESSFGEEFTDAEDEDRTASDPDPEEVVVETTALLDVERLLLASKRTA